MNRDTALHRFLETDPDDVGCEQAMEVLERSCGKTSTVS